MKKLFLMSLVFLSTMLAAQKPVEIKLWPNGAPNTNNMTQQVENGPLYVAEPTLTVYPAKEGNGMAIVACPGGGYTHLAMNHEGHDLANWFNSQGITYAVLTYRMPNGNNEVPLSDANKLCASCDNMLLNGTYNKLVSWDLRQADTLPALLPLILPMLRLVRISRFFSIQ